MPIGTKRSRGKSRKTTAHAASPPENNSYSIRSTQAYLSERFEFNFMGNPRNKKKQPEESKFFRLRGFLVSDDYSIDYRRREVVVALRRLLHRGRRGLPCRLCWRVRAEARSRQDHPVRSRATSG